MHGRPDRCGAGLRHDCFRARRKRPRAGDRGAWAWPGGGASNSIVRRTGWVPVTAVIRRHTSYTGDNVLDNAVGVDDLAAAGRSPGMTGTWSWPAARPA